MSLPADTRDLLHIERAASGYPVRAVADPGLYRPAIHRVAREPGCLTREVALTEAFHRGG